MGKQIKYNKLFDIVRINEHIIRPELIETARERIRKEAEKQLISCDRGECCSGFSCDYSCLEAESFLTGKNISDLDV